MADITGVRISQLATNGSLGSGAVFPHSQGGATMKVALSALTDYILSQVDEQTVMNAVSTWLEDHPEATTTVEDGAVTTAKLADGAVTSGKIADGTISAVDLSPSLLDSLLAKSSASGNVASFDDGASGVPLRGLTVTVEPKQAGSGDPSPTNIRPISGWTGCEVNRTGKNLVLLNSDAIVESKLITVGYRDGGIFATATGSYSRIAYGFNVKKGKQYTVSFIGKATGDYRRVYLGSKRNNINTYYTSITLSETEQRYTYSFTAVTDEFVPTFYITTSNTNGTMIITDFQLELGSTATSYEPYTGNTYSVTWSDTAGTVYGGTIDPIHGKLTVTHEIKTITTTENVSVNYSRCTVGSLYYGIAGEGIYCNALLVFYGQASRLPSNNIIVFSSTAYNEYVAYIRFADADSATTQTQRTTLTNQILAQMEADGHPLQIVFKLTNPVEYDIMPEEITTLIGKNNIWADTGSIDDCEYYADTKLYVDNAVKAAKNIIAGVETSMVATKNYSIGNLLIVGDTLYKVTAAIANGADIVVGTNVTATTVAEQLILLANS